MRERRALTLAAIESLFATRGHEQYTGEPVTHLEHALQTAQLAEDDGGSDALVTACLLHDIGHLVADHGDTPSLHGIDDEHQHAALPLLKPLFGREVLGAIGLHVDAKRYLCAVDPAYLAALSDDSKRSLRLQGGVYAPGEAAAFGARAGAAEAVRLRRCDDLAKVPGRPTRPLAHFLDRAARVTRPRP